VLERRRLRGPIESEAAMTWWLLLDAWVAIVIATLALVAIGGDHD